MPRWIYKLVLRVRSLVCGRQVEKELDEEIRFHLNNQIEELVAQGMSLQEARLAALRAMGNVELHKEICRDQRGIMWFEELRQDLRYGARALTRHPGFAVTGLLVLGIGIGINTAMFSIINAVLFRPLPVRAPDELVYLYQIYRNDRPPSAIFGDDYQYLKKHSAPLIDLTAHWGVSMTLTTGGESQITRSEWVDENYFDVLGVRAKLGRILMPADNDPASTQGAIVISDDLWQRRFHSDPAIIGRKVRVQDKEMTIVGVAESGFCGISDPWKPTQVWTTFAHGMEAVDMMDHYLHIGLLPIGRLRSGVSRTNAQAMLGTLADQLQKTRRAMVLIAFLALPANQIRMPDDPNGNIIPSRLALAMVAIMVMVLLIAIANISGILLSRGVTRTGEMAMRLALGAGSLRVFRQLLTESVLISVLGGGVGLFLAYGLMRTYRVITPDTFALDVSLDMRVLLFAAGVCILTGIVVGIAPGLQAVRVRVLTALAGGGVVAHGRVQSRLRNWVVIPQATLSLVLLIIAALYVRDLMKVEFSDLGYRTDSMMVLNIRLGDSPALDSGLRNDPGRAERQAGRTRTFYRQLMQRVGQMPESAAVAIASSLPIRTSTQIDQVAARDEFLGGDPQSVSTRKVGVSPGYFRAMGTPLLRGRDFDDRDGYTSTHVAIISEALARRIWQGRDPIGKSIAVNPMSGNTKIDWLEVVGIVGEVNPIVHEKGENPSVYVPLGQQWRVDAGYLIVYGGGDTVRLIDALKQAVANSDPFADINRVNTMKALVNEILYPRRVATATLTVSGLIGLLLASIGIYGVVSYSVAQRVREIGIRSALGAQRSDIVKLIVGEGARIAFMGSIFGAILAVAVIRLASRYVLTIPKVDWLTLAGMPLLLATVILFACYLPARRACRIDPMAALREL